MSFLVNINGYNGHYKITEEGLIVGVERWVKPPKGERMLVNRRIMTAFKNKHGYIGVKLSKNGVNKFHTLHRLLAFHFVPNPKNYPFVRHLNDIKTDNRLINLAWGTCSDNAKDAVRNGRVDCTKLINSVTDENIKRRVKTRKKRLEANGLEWHSEDTKSKISKSKKGVKSTPEQIEARRKGLIGHKKRSNIGYVGKNNHRWGTVGTRTGCVGILHPSAKKIIDNSTGTIYYGCPEAAMAAGISTKALRNRLNGEVKNNTSFEFM